MSWVPRYMRLGRMNVLMSDSLRTWGSFEDFDAFVEGWEGIAGSASSSSP